MAYDYALSPDKHLSVEEEKSLRASLAKHRDSDLRDTTMLLLMLICGLRAQEVLNLKKEDFNFTDKSVFVRTIKKGRHRSIPLPDGLVFRFKELFENIDGNTPFPITTRRLRQIWEQYKPCKKGSHSLRHTAARNIFKTVKDLSLAQYFLGHKTISTTSVYLQSQVSAELLRKAVA